MPTPNSLPDFNLIGTDKQMHSPAEYADKDGLLVIFSCNHCPTAIAYMDRISDLVSRYSEKVGVFAISSNNVNEYPADSFENMGPVGQKLGLDGKYLYDETQDIARSFEASRTPEVFLYNKERELVYHGAIDDNRYMPEEVKEKYLETALDAMLTGKPIENADTPPVGCSIKWK